MRIITPAANWLSTNVTRFMMLLPVETPEMPALVPKCPTTSISTAPYMACKICAPRMGTMNCIILPNMLPLVKSCLLSSIDFSTPYVKRQMAPSPCRIVL